MSDLDVLSRFCSSLSFPERKALITLARSQSIPNSDHSPVLYSKVVILLNRLVRYPPYTSLADELLDHGRVVLRFLHSSLTCGLLIVYALGVSLSDDDAHYGKRESFLKELLATQTRRSWGRWNWDAIMNVSRSHEVIHPWFPNMSRLQRMFSLNLPRLRQQYQDRIILPHYTRRGVSSETASLLLNRVAKVKSRSVYGNPRSYHRHLDRGNVTSKDVVHHYVRSGSWIYGKTEMKQRWYPHGLLPRTYFAWGGCDIAIAGYLRNFFNDLGDAFPPTDRHNRVQSDWLQDSSLLGTGGFLFYDLISFTSWFHEQVPFLRSCQEYFSGVRVFLLGSNLTITSHDLGSLIGGYVDWCNDFAGFNVAGNLMDGTFSDREYRHECAGFLGVPGNLVTCTLPHGLALAALFSRASQLQVPGDDVGAAYKDDDHQRDIKVNASTLGALQFDKVFSTPELCIYLKRLVLDLGTRIELAPMLIFPLLPYLVNPSSRDSIRSNRFRLPDRNKLRSRAARVLVAFHRDLWKLTKGDIDSDSYEIILLFLRRVHTMVGLPNSAIFQGRVYGDDDSDSSNHYPDISVKFSVEDDLCLYHNPDLEFAGKYVTRMSIRLTNEVELSRIEGDLVPNTSLVVRKSKAWSFLEDMGYVEVLGIPGEVVELVGADARDAYLFAAEPPLREVRVISYLDMQQLAAVGIVNADESGFYSSKVVSESHVDVNTRSWRYRKYVDLDDPKSAGFYGRSREWIQEGVLDSRESLSPESMEYDLDY